jgi:hypothetical protein
MKNEIFLGNFELNEAKTLKIRLEALQVQTEIRANEHTCKTGNCKITVELWGLEEDKDKIIELFRKDFFKNLGHSELNFEALNSVFDPQSESVTCQACGFQFSPENAECPDCGLSYR